MNDAGSAQGAEPAVAQRGQAALNPGVDGPLNDTDHYDFRGYARLIRDSAGGWFYEGR